MVSINVHWRFVFSVFFYGCIFSQDYEENISLPGGTPCKANQECFSGLCHTEFKNPFCGPHAFVNGSLTGGAYCTHDRQCYSGYCYNKTCAPDSSVIGKVAAGGPCHSGGQCFSNYCKTRRCLADSAEVGFLAAGASCDILHERCFSGFCHSSQCAPDAPKRDTIPSGGPCSHDSHCLSKVCFHNRCSPSDIDDEKTPKVANGGHCHNEDNCVSGSLCDSQICLVIPKAKTDDDDVSSKKSSFYDVVEPPPVALDKQGKVYAGGPCVKDDECVSNIPCVRGRCAPHSTFNASLIADGGPCDADMQCASGECSARVCSVSFGSYKSTGWTAAGAYCDEHRSCFSFRCYKHKCGADAFADEPVTRRPDATELYANRVAAGGDCTESRDCYSDLCENAICAPDGPQVRTVAGGGLCQRHEQCASGYCYENICVVGGRTPGRVAAGGRCRTSDQCAPGSMCVDLFCRRPRDETNRLQSSANTLAPKQVCWSNAQCKTGRCVARRCVVPLNPTSIAVRNAWLTSVAVRPGSVCLMIFAIAAVLH